MSFQRLEHCGIAEVILPLFTWIPCTHTAVLSVRAKIASGTAAGMVVHYGRKPVPSPVLTNDIADRSDWLSLSS
jgi:hypothetical protein